MPGSDLTLKSSDFSITRTHLGSGKKVNRFEAAVVYANQNEYVALKDFLIRFEDCPVVVFVGDCQPAGAFAQAKCMPAATSPAEVTTCVKNCIVEKKKDILEVFANFDSDLNGHLERTELKKATVKLGLKMSEIDIDNMMKDLDFDCDGKISIDEFQKWWLGGRKGQTGTMS
jgi:hypothetical protein